MTVRPILLDEAVAQTQPHVDLTRASDVEPVPIRWLWPDWLALGKMHVLGGGSN